MSWFKVLTHDFRCGLLRYRYLLIPIIVIFPCIMFHHELYQAGISGNWADYMLYCFKGQAYEISRAATMDAYIPTAWILTVGLCLYLNLDYLINDLTCAGQQVIIRCDKKRNWFLSKCIWNISSCLLFFLLLVLSVTLFVLWSGGSMTLENSEAASLIIFESVIQEPLKLSALQNISIAIVSPLLTIIAFSLMEMVLCLFCKPIISFLTCLCLLGLSIFTPPSYIPGNGAMTIRSDFVANDGINWAIATIGSIILGCLCILIGIIYFKHADVLSFDE